MTQDFDELVKLNGVDLEALRPLYEDIRDQIPFPYDVKVTTKHSAIEGLGLFITETIACGEDIAPARIDGKRTPAGRYTNHSNQPNAQMVVRGRTIVLVARVDLEKDTEVLVDYREALALTIE